MYKVFLVDDEIVIREGIRNSFPWEENGFTLVGEAPDGELALQTMQDVKPDILITDIRMPFMDGMQLCEAVSHTMPWVQIVILSGYDDFTYAQQANGYFQMDVVLMGIILLGVLGICFEKIVKFLERRLTGWQETIQQ